jgi:hypothetical protein
VLSGLKEKQTARVRTKNPKSGTGAETVHF